MIGLTVTPAVVGFLAGRTSYEAHKSSQRHHL